MGNVIQQAQPVTKVELMKSDGESVLAFRNAEAKITLETRKDKEGKEIETGVKKTEFVFRKTKSQLEAGEGIKVVNEDGSVSMYSEIRFTGRELDADALQARSEADKVKRIVTNLRLALGLSKTSKKVVAERDKLTPQDVANWMNGNRQLFGKVFDTLPTATQAAVSKVYADSIKTPKAKAPTMSQLAEMAALAAANGTPLGDEWHEQFNAIKAKAAKLQKGKAVEPEVLLTEQSDI